MNQILNYLSAHFKEDLKSNEVAKKFHLNQFSFSKKFNKQTGLSFGLYLQQLRLSEAKKLLSEGASIKEACYSSGFQSSSQFFRVFRKHTGVSPKEYLNNKMNKKIIAEPNDSILTSARKAINYARIHSVEVDLIFNGVSIKVNPLSFDADIATIYSLKSAN